MSAFATSPRHSLANLPHAQIAKGVPFTRVTEAMLRECARAKLSGTRERVLIALLRFIKLSPDGEYLVSRPAAEIAELLGVSEGNVRRACCELCDPAKCCGKALLRSVSPGRAGSVAVYALDFDWPGNDLQPPHSVDGGKDAPRREGSASASKPCPPLSASVPKRSALQTAPASASVPPCKRFGTEAPRRDERDDEDTDTAMMGATFEGWFKDEN